MVHKTPAATSMKRTAWTRHARPTARAVAHPRTGSIRLLRPAPILRRCLDTTRASIRTEHQEPFSRHSVRLPPCATSTNERCWHCRCDKLGAGLGGPDVSARDAKRDLDVAQGRKG